MPSRARRLRATQNANNAAAATAAASESSTAPAPAAPAPTPTLTNRPAPVHFDELAAIWPADPRIPSVESRRAWALARNILPESVHVWFRRRRPIAKKLRLKIPADSYELPVGTPPVVPVVIKDEPVEVDVPAPTAEPTTSLKRKRNAKVEVEVDEKIPEPTKEQPRKKKQQTAGSASSSNTVTAESDAPLVPIKTAKIKADIEDPAPAKKTLKRKRDTENDAPAPSTVPEAAPEPTTQPKRKRKKTGIESSDAVTSDPAQTQSPKKKKKKKKKTVPLAAPKKSKKTVRSAEAPPSSSPTLRASSPPASDAPTLLDDSPASSPPSNSPKNSAYTHLPVEPDASNAAPKSQSSASKKSRAPKKKRKTKAKDVAAPAPAGPASEPAPAPEERYCDQGNSAASTGFTCVLCAAPTPADVEFGGEFDYVFGFGLAAGSGAVDGGGCACVVDVTSLSALPFLADPAEFLAARAGEVACEGEGDAGFVREEDGGFVLDGQRFTCDGMHVGGSGSGGAFFPVSTTDWGARMRVLGLGEDGMPLGDGTGVDGDVDVDGEGWGGDREGWGRYPDALRLPAFAFHDMQGDEDY